MDLPPELRVGVLGPLEVVVGTSEVVVPVGNQRRLLASLLLARGRMVGAARLVEDVWDADAPEMADAALHTTVARLRRTLGAAASRLARGPGGYRLQVDRRDDEQFLALVARARDAGGRERLALYEEALGLWRGEAWHDVRDLAVAEAGELAEARLRAAEGRAEARLEVGDADAAVVELRGMVLQRPLRERTVALLMDALDRTGAVDEALEEYTSFRERLAEELGLDPSPDLVRLHERVLRGGLPGTQPPAVARADAVAASVAGAPQAPRHLVGREEMLEQLASRVVPGTLVTLVGPGGVGKTSLARALAGRDGPVWWVDLAEAEREEDLLEAVLSGTGGHSGIGEDPATVVAQRLAAATGLLVLDNCEHLLEAVGSLVAASLPAAPGLAVLATSRRRLGLSDERILPVSPLRVDGGAEPPAVELFLQRATEAAPGLQVSAAVREQAAAVCRRLDGLPLAIELAAGQVGAVPLLDLAAHLTSDLDLLETTGRVGHERHRTLRNTIRWSYRRLEPEHRLVLQALGIFPSSFELGAAQRVAGSMGLPPGRVAAAVAELVHRSLVVPPDADGRLRLLETVRIFVREQTDAAATDALVGAHASWVMRLCEEASSALSGADEADWARRVVRALPDVRSVVAGAIERGDAELPGRVVERLGRWAYTSMDSEILGWAEELARTRAEPEGPVLVHAAVGAWMRGDHALSAHWASRALATPPRPGHPETRHLAHEILGDNAVFTGDPATGAEHYASAVELAERAGRTADVALAWCGVALATLYGGGDPEAARNAADRALAQAHQARNPSAIAMAWYVDGEVSAESDPDRALASLVRASEVDVGPVVGLSSAVARTARSALLSRSGPLVPATFAHVADTLEHWSTHGQRSFLLTTLRNTVPLLVRCGEDRLALRLGDALASTPTEHASYGSEAASLTAYLERAAERTEPHDRGRWIDIASAAVEVASVLRRRAS